MIEFSDGNIMKYVSINGKQFLDQMNYYLVYTAHGLSRTPRGYVK
jgi:hypothetical protein